MEQVLASAHLKLYDWVMLNLLEPAVHLLQAGGAPWRQRRRGSQTAGAS